MSAGAWPAGGRGRPAGRRPPPRRLSLAAALASALAVATGCGSGDGAPPSDGAAETRPAPERGEGSSPRLPSPPPGYGEPVPAADRPMAEVPILGPESLPELRTYPLLLVNRRSIDALVYADAGARSVLLDTLARLDSSRVDVRVQALRLRLLATDRWGERLASESVDLMADSVVRWEVPAGGGGDSTGGGGG